MCPTSPGVRVLVVPALADCTHLEKYRKGTQRVVREIMKSLHSSQVNPQTKNPQTRIVDSKSPGDFPTNSEISALRIENPPESKP